jgi:hypothetical protein
LPNALRVILTIVVAFVVANYSYGPPIQLDWSYHDTTPYNVNDYEDIRQLTRQPRISDLLLNYYQRMELLEHAGYTPEQLKRTTRRINAIKRQRETTKFFLPVSKVEEAVQSASRKVKRVGGGTRSSKRPERKPKQ